MIREQHLPLVERRRPGRNEDTVYFEPDMQGMLGVADYRAVISQIKREVLVEISGHSNGSVSALNSIPDAKLTSLLTQTRLEAKRRGLLDDYAPRTRPRTTMNLSQTLLAVLLFPAARKRLERILTQTALGGLELLEKAKDNIATMMEDELL